MNRTVLIVDDDVNARIIAETLLRLRGVDVRVAGDGLEACEIIRHESIALVIADLNLPGMNGFELVRRLRSRFGMPQLSPETPRILVMTDRKEPEVERFVMRLGADAFLRKPLAPRWFLTIVESLLPSAALPQASQAARP